MKSKVEKEVKITLELTETEFLALVASYGCASMNTRKESLRDMSIDKSLTELDEMGFYDELVTLAKQL